MLVWWATISHLELQLKSNEPQGPPTMKIRTLLLATALSVSASGAVNAQPFELLAGPYISLGAGVNWLQSSRLETDIFGPGNLGKVPFDAGGTVNGAVGYAFGWGLRVEVEGSYRRNTPSGEMEGGFCGGASIDDNFSKVNQLGIMANAAFDINFGSPIVPYIGGGVGGVRTRIYLASECATFIPDDKQWGFAYQGFAGLDYMLTPAFRIGARYTYMHTEDLKNLEDFGCMAVCQDTLDPTNHSVTVQLAYNFGSPRVIAAPPPPPPPAAPLQRNFLVFFDFDRSDITAEADRVIVQAANNAKTATVTTITLTGHADRSGPVPYNQRLSERRARAVADRLVREGIPPSAIVTIGRGETQPLVPTADGVREPQNRRVEIVF
jgi:OmpA-OmpF porin, OOP family